MNTPSVQSYLGVKKYIINSERFHACSELNVNHLYSMYLFNSNIYSGERQNLSSQLAFLALRVGGMFKISKNFYFDYHVSPFNYMFYQKENNVNINYNKTELGIGSNNIFGLKYNFK